MKKIDGKFMVMGIFFLLAGLALQRFLMTFSGLAFIIYSFFSKGMEPTKENIFKPKFPKKRKRKKK